MMRHLTLRQQITILVGLLCLSLVCAAAAGAAYIAYRQTKQEIMADSAEAASTLAAILDRGMSERFREIRNLANMQPLKGIWASDQPRVRQVLDQLQSSYPDYSWIGFAKPDGTVLASTRGLLEGVSVAERPWFKDGLKSPAVGDVHEAKLLDKLLRPVDSTEPLRFVDFAAPVHGESGELLGVIGSHLNWGWARERLQIILARDGGARPEAIWILSNDGTVLLGPERTTKPFSDERIAVMKQAQAGTFEDDSGSEAVLTGFALTKGYRDYPGLGWIVVSRQPENIAFAAARNIVWPILTLGVVVAILGVMVALFIAQGVAKPLRTITEAADRIGRDPTISLPPYATGSREIIRLSRALRSLIRRAGAAEEKVLAATNQHEKDISDLTRLAETDALSGLLNRRGFELLGDDAFDQFKRYGRGFAVLLVDIDFFKKVNDTYGHAAGDEVIRVIGETLTSHVRPSDKVSRFGGEEFVVLLRETGREGIITVAQQLRRAVETSRTIYRDQTLAITISVGGALVTNDDRDIRDVLERADSALYEAKAAGRNRVIVAGLQPQLASAVA